MQLTQRFNDALQFAMLLHAEQVRKVSGEPYVVHLLGVTSLALDYGADEDEAIAALLHDAIEDQGGIATGEEIQRRFGPAVAAIVRGCTTRHQAQAALARAERRLFSQARHASPSVRLVAASHKLHNVRSPLPIIVARARRSGGILKAGGKDPVVLSCGGGSSQAIWHDATG